MAIAARKGGAGEEIVVSVHSMRSEGDRAATSLAG